MASSAFMIGPTPTHSVYRFIHTTPGHQLSIQVKVTLGLPRQHFLSGVNILKGQKDFS